MLDLASLRRCLRLRPMLIHSCRCAHQVDGLAHFVLEDTSSMVDGKHLLWHPFPHSAHADAAVVNLSYPSDDVA